MSRRLVFLKETMTGLGCKKWSWEEGWPEHSRGKGEPGEAGRGPALRSEPRAEAGRGPAPVSLEKQAEAQPSEPGEAGRGPAPVSLEKQAEAQSQ